jgi:hypothetical protein
MKSLTLTQPYATLVALRLKKLETRARPLTYTGPLAIHAGLGAGYFKSEAKLWACCQSEPFRSALAKHGITDPAQLPRGKIVAVGHLVGCASTEQICEDNGIWRIIGGRRHHWALTEQEASFGDYSPGRYAWLLADVRALAEPIGMNDRSSAMIVASPFGSRPMIRQPVTLTIATIAPRGRRAGLGNPASRST